GNQLDDPTYVTNTNNAYPDNSTGYSGVAKGYIGTLGTMANVWLNYTNRIFTSDFGLYWFDYQSSYNAVFGEFLEKQNTTQKQLAIALDRGAAESFNRDWGTII